MREQAKTQPLLSIIIPTRNRVPYAISAMRSILEISDPRLELAVQDNGESRELEQWIQANLKDARLRYAYCAKPLSFIDNFNAAVELTTGEYLCLIGDDDGVNPEIMEAAAWAKSGNLDALAVATKTNYFWPGTPPPFAFFTKLQGGSLLILDFRCRLVATDGEQAMRKLVRDGGASYLRFDLPKLYHGLVHRRCLTAIREKTDNYFGGLSPDIFSSLAIACVARRIVVTDYPLTIPGICQVSASAVEGVMRKHSKRLEDAPHLRNRGEYRWCEYIPRVYTATTIWADSAVAALRAMGRDDLVRQLNLPRLAACCLWFNRGVARVVLRDLFMGLRAMHKNPVAGSIQLAWNLLLLAMNCGVKFARRVWNRIFILLGLRTVCVINGLENMVEVSHVLTRYLKEHGYSFHDCVRRAKS